MSITQAERLEAPQTTDTYHKGWVTYFSVLHILGSLGIFIAPFYVLWPINVCAVVYFFLTHLSITLGAHRLYSHESFRTWMAVQYGLVLQFSAAFQGPLVWWSSNHRRHHRFEDKSGEDPHTPEDGFWHAHMLWLMKHSGLAPVPTQFSRHFIRKEGEKLIYAPALWQSKHHMRLGVLMAFVLPTLVGGVVGYFSQPTLVGVLVGLVQGFLVIGCGRLLLQYHLTWVVNSVCHTYGARKEGRSTNINWVLAILTVGESLHANHHEFAGDCKLSQCWYEIDLGWYVLWSMNKVGLVWNLRRPSLSQN